MIQTLNRTFTTLLVLSSISGISAVANQDIIGGKTVASSDVIAQRSVALVMEVLEDGQKGTGLCSGSIIDNSHILTAAHCVEGFQQGYVVFDTKSVIADIQNHSPKAVKMTSAKAMPGFPGIQNANNDGEFPDYAIITFAGGLQAGYTPAHFLSAADVSDHIKASATLTLAGYGITSAPKQAVLKKTDLFIESDEGKNPAGQKPASTGLQGAGTLRKVDVTVDHLSPKKIDVFVEGQVKHIACEGDSGGPAMLVSGGDTYVVGVDSRGDCNSFAIYSVITSEMVNKFIK